MGHLAQREMNHLGDVTRVLFGYDKGGILRLFSLFVTSEGVTP
jgi:hypothetical protein